MIADSRYKTFQAVIVYKLDRFARNRYDSAMYKSKLKANGVRVLSAKEHITDSPEGIILEGLLEAMNEYYSAELPRRSSVACVRMPSRARLPAATCSGLPHRSRQADGDRPGRCITGTPDLHRL